IKIMTGAKVTRLDKKGDGVTAAIEDAKGQKSSLTIDRVISAVGVVGNVENLGLEKLGVKLDRGTIVIDGLGRTNVPGIYAIGEDQGLVKVIFDKKTGQLLGAHMVGAEVTELIQGYVVAMNLETTEEELMHTVFPHPTLSEMMKEAVLDAYGRVLNI